MHNSALKSPMYGKFLCARTKLILLGAALVRGSKDALGRRLSREASEEGYRTCVISILTT